MSGASPAGLPRWHFGEPIGLPRTVLERGGVLVLPTESSYGLAVDPRDGRGVEAIYALKERERGKPLPVVAAGIAQLGLLEVDDPERLLARFARFWPAPLSLVLPTRRAWPAGGGERSLAVRVPAHAGLRQLLLDLGHPLTATSANPSGAAPLVAPEEVDRWLVGRDALLVEGAEGGLLCGGPPSTVISAQPGGTSGAIRVIRQGAFSLEAALSQGEGNEPT